MSNKSLVSAFICSGRAHTLDKLIGKSRLGTSVSPLRRVLLRVVRALSLVDVLVSIVRLL